MGLRRQVKGFVSQIYERSFKGSVGVCLGSNEGFGFREFCRRLGSLGLGVRFRV